MRCYFEIMFSKDLLGIGVERFKEGRRERRKRKGRVQSCLLP
jgi:hypothetical protein